MPFIPDTLTLTIRLAPVGDGFIPAIPPARSICGLDDSAIVKHNAVVDLVIRELVVEISSEILRAIVTFGASLKKYEMLLCYR